ncbi:TAXI family TRAP transporter solute-binding subunit [candidate division KSB1 bacterium]|nr:TAXI family TRAP transporter solute-binding subunit [candidate division KSB1 bacterium]NIR73303.1 TAXI family TRAP transporter solute-binding subunit [candidate division KSB1 bacterium]NIS27009.1 TAXI family TRAP transporter solute-binding subunit [candidate division KSB1 bacterium]NIT73849.1 TAXI family TRAP transporter solute-binding subunit [candidate division KSB1 bacterium]NIU27754.1 TAXI family TRAP transporter solute-binding subunit [candidate division KSB1 bacterium]
MDFDMMKKAFRASSYFLIPFLLLSSIGTTGCGSSEEGDASGDRRFLSVGTAPPGGAFFVVGGAIAQVVSDNVTALQWEVSAEATKGTQENIRRLSGGALDFALANAAISYFAVRGEGAWERTYPIRTVMTLAPNVALFITPKSSGVKTIADLKGKRVTVGPAGAGFEYFLEPILNAHGVTYDDFTPLHNTQAGAVDMLADGSAAAAFLGGAVPTASITQACASQDIHFILFEEEAKQSLIETYPFFESATIPANTYRGQNEPFHGLNVGSMHLITFAEVDDETVYQFTKTLYEHREDVVQKHPAGKAINAKNIVKDTGTPFHRGAIHYYKEIGIWPEGSATASNSAGR